MGFRKGLKAKKEKGRGNRNWGYTQECWLQREIEFL